MATKPKFDDQRYRHPLYKKLWMYKRANSENWWCRFYHKSKPYRCSTQSKHKAEAESFAGDWFFKKKVAIESGIEAQKKENLPTVKDAVILTERRYRASVERGVHSKETLKGILQVWRQWILPYFEKMPIQNVTRKTWNGFIDYAYEKKSKIAHRTLYQIRNGLSIALNTAIDEEWITIKPELSINFQIPTNEVKGRVWFNPDEQKQLKAALDENIDFHKHTPHRRGSIELKDYVLFMLHSGLRVGESRKVTFFDVEIVTEKTFTPYIMIRGITGKRSIGGSSKSDSELIRIYRSILEHAQPNSMDELLFNEHHDRMFTEMLKRHKLKYDSYGRKRDFISLRHTYICNQLIEEVPIAEVAINSRNNPSIIIKHYADALGPEYLISINKKDDKKFKKEVISIKDQKRMIEITKQSLSKSLDKLNEDYNKGIKKLPDSIANGNQSTFIPESSTFEGKVFETSEGEHIDVKLPETPAEKEVETNIKKLMNKYGLTFEELKERIDSISD